MKLYDKVRVTVDKGKYSKEGVKKVTSAQLFKNV